MKYRTLNRLQIGDIQAFKKMLADAIKNKETQDQHEANNCSKCYPKNFTYNDQFYSFNPKNIIDSADS